MVIMFNRDQAALLSIQLLIMSQVFAEMNTVEHRNVSRGESVIFTCNISETDVTQIAWTKGRFFSSFLFSNNTIFSNFTSHRLRIDYNLPSTMNISNVQHDDAGSYRCCLFDVRGTRSIEWNLEVFVEHEETSPLRYSLYILPAVIGFILCVITPAVCLYRKLRARTPNQSPAPDQFHHSAEEMTSTAPQGDTDTGTNSRSQYEETLNTIYGL